MHRPTHSRRLTSVAATGVAIALVAAGCSSSSSTNSSASPSSSASASASAVTLTPAVKAQLQAVLDATRTQFGFPGVQAGVWTDGEQWVGTSGTVGAGQTPAPTPADHTRIGSITKTMTATVVLQLIDEGKLSFDDVVDKYVPGMPNGSKATLRNLLEMTSGIPTYTAGTTVVNQYAAKPTTVFTPQQLVDSVKKMPAMFTPGTQMFYSNTNYVLLGMIIEKVTGQQIGPVFKARILDPLKMSQTSVPGTSSAIPTPYLSGTSTQTNPEGTVKNATNWSPTLAFTAGEVISTLDDLRIWGIALGTGRGILNAATQKLRVDSVKTTVPPNTADRSYGLGIVNTGGWLGHTGEIPGYNTTVQYYPDTHTTIVVMVNSDIMQGNAAPAVTTFEGLAKVMTP
ncbi:MAG: serine hydrolase domain-containing protein [Actinomycetes bacterium]